jgi:hypothetical protein
LRRRHRYRLARRQRLLPLVDASDGDSTDHECSQGPRQAAPAVRAVWR